MGNKKEHGPVLTTKRLGDDFTPLTSWRKQYEYISIIDGFSRCVVTIYKTTYSSFRAILDFQFSDGKREYLIGQNFTNFADCLLCAFNTLAVTTVLYEGD